MLESWGGWAADERHFKGVDNVCWGLLLLLGWLGPIHAISDGQETSLWGGGVVANVVFVGSR